MKVVRYLTSASLILLLSGAVLNFLTKPAMAQGGSGNPVQQTLDLLRDPDFGLEEIKSEVASIEITVQDIDTAVLDIEEKVDRLELSVLVDEAVCASVPIQCGDGTTGHSFNAASSSNHNPVRIAALVTLNGSPVTGLSAADFSFSNPFVPAGGPGAVLCPLGGTGCAAPGSLFQASGPMYQMYLHPFPVGSNWKAGAYFARLAVNDGMGHTSEALVKITIP